VHLRLLGSFCVLGALYCEDEILFMFSNRRQFCALHFAFENILSIPIIASESPKQVQLKTKLLSTQTFLRYIYSRDDFYRGFYLLNA